MTLFEQALADIDALEIRQVTTIGELRISDPDFVAWLGDANTLIGNWHRTMGREATMALAMHCIQKKKLRFLLTHMSSLSNLTGGGQFLGDWGVVLSSETIYERYFPEEKAARLAKSILTYSRLAALVDHFHHDNLTPEQVIDRIKQAYPGQPFNEKTVWALAERSIRITRSEIRVLKKLSN